MADDVLLAAQQKGRSASICAPGFSSMEAMAASAAASSTPDSAGGTPSSSRRRRPAARSQSARITGGKSVRRRAAAASGSGAADFGGGSHHMRAGVSEPRLCDPNVVPSINTPEASPGLRRRGSSRRSVHHSHGHGTQPRKSTAFLDVPDAGRGEDEDEDSYRLRSFSLTSKGLPWNITHDKLRVVNRGDSFRRRRSRSNSLVPPLAASAQEEERQPEATPPSPYAQPSSSSCAAQLPQDVSTYRVAIIGSPGVGKSALISQFMTSECINAYDRQRDVPKEQSVSIMLNGEESELCFINVNNAKAEVDRSNPPDAFVFLYSVIDKASFQKAEDELTKLQDLGLLRTRPFILVGNKVDLVRSRSISAQDGKCLACTYRAKFIEISVGISHNVDELLVGILNQIRLKRLNADQPERESPPRWYKSRGMIRASMKARQMLTWLFGKEDIKFRNCENLHEL